MRACARTSAFGIIPRKFSASAAASSWPCFLCFLLRGRLDAAVVDFVPAFYDGCTEFPDYGSWRARGWLEIGDDVGVLVVLIFSTAINTEGG